MNNERRPPDDGGGKPRVKMKNNQNRNSKSGRGRPNSGQKDGGNYENQGENDNQSNSLNMRDGNPKHQPRGNFYNRGSRGRGRGQRNSQRLAGLDANAPVFNINAPVFNPNASVFVPGQVEARNARGGKRGRGRAIKIIDPEKRQEINIARTPTPDQGDRRNGQSKSPRKESSRNRRQNGQQKNQHKQAQQADINALADGVSKLISKRQKTQMNEDQHEILVRKIQKNLLECSICLDKMKHYEKVWQCVNCYNLLHLKCATEWGKAALKDNETWRCPYCQHESRFLPNRYYCYCGREENPTASYGELAHSCHQPCERPQKCPHQCILNCHPGACPPCKATSLVECSCGKTKARIKCGTDLRCEEICGRQLSCGYHDCKDKCHPGECKPCEEIDLLECVCGRVEKEVPCGVEYDWSCGQKCPNMKDCGNHPCELVCHEGECEKCPYTPEKVSTCPCGAIPVMRNSRKSCLDPIPTCDSFCEKELICGHKCPENCHEGKCPPCAVELKVECRCGRTGDLTVNCHTYFMDATAAQCKRPCKKKMSCGRHTCQVMCCPDRLDSGPNSHICTKACGRMLQCGTHRCEQVCHRGNCRRCLDVSFNELTCHCGAQVSYPPIQCGQRPPECEELCRREHSCSHAVHHNCHSDESCPPCTVLTEKRCNCGKEVRRNIPCHLNVVSCGRPCGRALDCGHTCPKICHEGECITEENQVCQQKCQQIRPTCGHICAKKCHTGSACEPFDYCEVKIPLKCACKRRTQNFLCPKIEHMKSHQLKMMAQQGQAIPSGEMILTIECDDECEVQERNRQIAAALAIDNPVISSIPEVVYPESIVRFASERPKLAITVETNLRRLAKQCEEAPEKGTFEYNLPPMNKKERMFVHELSDFYNIESKGRGAEPKRHLLLVAVKGMTIAPPNTLSKMLKISPSAYQSNWTRPVSNKFY
ncbi:unnamed protein product [Oikopleura dioica]|uniref:R3H domain-containing protein n=1 Tax=Oikopleura dioica TaxID=34765 RepID=E4WVH2_OIKDI|nr:unnamed protein product [Oikopleura dioica]